MSLIYLITATEKLRPLKSDTYMSDDVCKWDGVKHHIYKMGWVF